MLITRAAKGEGSVNYGIRLLRQQTIYVTPRSTNSIGVPKLRPEEGPADREAA